MYEDKKDCPRFKDLPKKAQERIKAKARWDHITLSAVIREYPDLWEAKGD